MSEVVFARHVVAVEDAPGLVAEDLHDDGLVVAPNRQSPVRRFPSVGYLSESPGKHPAGARARAEGARGSS